MQRLVTRDPSSLDMDRSRLQPRAVASLADALLAVKEIMNACGNMMETISDNLEQTNNRILQSQERLVHIHKESNLVKEALTKTCPSGFAFSEAPAFNGRGRTQFVTIGKRPEHLNATRDQLQKLPDFKKLDKFRDCLVTDRKDFSTLYSDPYFFVRQKYEKMREEYADAGKRSREWRQLNPRDTKVPVEVTAVNRSKVKNDFGVYCDRPVVRRRHDLTTPHSLHDSTKITSQDRPAECPRNADLELPLLPKPNRKHPSRTGSLCSNCFENNDIQSEEEDLNHRPPCFDSSITDVGAENQCESLILEQITCTQGESGSDFEISTRSDSDINVNNLPASNKSQPPPVPTCVKRKHDSSISEKTATDGGLTPAKPKSHINIMELIRNGVDLTPVDAPKRNSQKKVGLLWEIRKRKQEIQEQAQNRDFVEERGSRRKQEEFDDSPEGRLMQALADLRVAIARKDSLDSELSEASDWSVDSRDEPQEGLNKGSALRKYQ